MKQMLAQVTVDQFGKLEASINPNLADREKVVLACQCAEMFAKMAAEGVMVLEGLDGQKKTDIIVPPIGFAFPRRL